VLLLAHARAHKRFFAFFMRAQMKKAKKMLAIYKQTFGFNPPIRILVDGTFSQASVYIIVPLPDGLVLFVAIQTGWSCFSPLHFVQ
jgi:hypothetical protein